MTVCIVGWAHGNFGRFPEESIESLLGSVAKNAVADAGIDASEVDAAYVGMLNVGFSRQDFPSPLLLESLPELRFKPITRLENACATGSAAIHAGINYIESGKGRIVLVAGAEKMTDVPTSQAGDNLLCCSYRASEGNIPGGFAGVFAQIADRYFQRYGDKSASLARIAAKNHLNALENPWAQMRKDLGFDFCNTLSEKNPYVVQPLRRTDCAPISDGSAAIVLSDIDTALSMRKAVAIRAAEQMTDFMPLNRRDPTWFEAANMAWKCALKTARISLKNL